MADPAELASLIRTFLAARPSGVGPQHAAPAQLADIARASVADALTIVSAEGLLRRVERNLTVPTGSINEVMLAVTSILLLDESLNSKNDATACASPRSPTCC